MVPPGSLSYYVLVVELATGCAAQERGTPRFIPERVSLPTLIRDALRQLEVSRSYVVCGSEG